NLADLAQTWVKEKCTDDSVPKTARTPAYIDLIFAFGLARLNEADAARTFLKRAESALANADEVHQFLFHAHDYRVQQALEGKRHAGPLPAERMQELEGMDRMRRYVVDRLRQHSRILEPHLRIEPYRHCYSHSSELDKALADLTDLADKGDKAQVTER